MIRELEPRILFVPRQYGHATATDAAPQRNGLEALAATLSKSLYWAGGFLLILRSSPVVEVIEQADGFIVCSGQFRETFRRKSYALLAANMLAAAEAILHDCDVAVLVPMGNGEAVMRVNAPTATRTAQLAPVPQVGLDATRP